MPFIKPYKAQKSDGGGTSSLEELCCHLFLVPDLRIRDIAAQLDKFTAVGITEP